MEDLLVLVQFFQSTKFKSSGLLNVLLELGTQMRSLFNVLATGNIKTDKEALQEIP